MDFLRFRLVGQWRKHRAGGEMHRAACRWGATQSRRPVGIASCQWGYAQNRLPVEEASCRWGYAQSRLPIRRASCRWRVTQSRRPVGTEDLAVLWRRTSEQSSIPIPGYSAKSPRKRQYRGKIGIEAVLSRRKLYSTFCSIPIDSS